MLDIQGHDTLSVAGSVLSGLLADFSAAILGDNVRFHASKCCTQPQTNHPADEVRHPPQFLCTVLYMLDTLGFDSSTGAKLCNISA